MQLKEVIDIFSMVPIENKVCGTFKYFTVTHKISSVYYGLRDVMIIQT